MALPTQVAVIPIATSRVLVSLVPPLSNQHVFTLLANPMDETHPGFKKKYYAPTEKQPIFLKHIWETTGSRKKCGAPSTLTGGRP